MEERIFIHSCSRYDRYASSIQPADTSLTGNAGQVLKDVHAHAHWKLERYSPFFFIQVMRYSYRVIRVDEEIYHC